MSTHQAGAAQRPLEGLRVVEVSSFVAAPLAGMTLGQLGADVIRVDPIGGSGDIHRWPLAEDAETSLYWVGLNKTKRSLTVDFRSDRGRELIASLVCDSGPGGGILLTNAGGRDWLSYDVLSRRRPDLIHVQIDGKHDGSSAVDYTINAGMGFPLVTGPPGWAEPINHVLPAWDIACGLYASVALLSAELRRRSTGEGAQLRIPLEDVALATAGNLGFLAEAQVTKVDRPRVGNHLYGSFARDFVTKDNHRVMVVALTNRHWRDLLTATGLQDAIGGLERTLGIKLSSEAARYDNREALAGLLQRWFGDNDLAHVIEQLSKGSMLWSRYRTFTEVVDQQSAAPGRSVLTEIDQPGVGRHLAPGSPIAIGPRGSDVQAATAPMLGEHARSILGGDLGLTDGEIGNLVDAGVVGKSGARPAVASVTR